MVGKLFFVFYFHQNKLLKKRVGTKLLFHETIIFAVLKFLLNKTNNKKRNKNRSFKLANDIEANCLISESFFNGKRTED